MPGELSGSARWRAKLNRASVYHLLIQTYDTHLNVEEVFGEDGRAVIDRDTLTVELATKHLRGDRHLEHITRELAMRMRIVNVSRAFKDLCNKTNDRAVSNSYNKCKIWTRANI